MVPRAQCRVPIFLKKKSWDKTIPSEQHCFCDLQDWSTDSKVGNSGLKMGLSAHCRVPLHESISESDS